MELSILDLVLGLIIMELMESLEPVRESTKLILDLKIESMELLSNLTMELIQLVELTDLME